MGHKFVVTVAPGDIAFKGTLTGGIHFRLSGGRVTTFSIPFRVRLCPEFVITPDTVVFDAASRAGSTLTADIEGPSRFRVERVAVPTSIRALVPSGEARSRQRVVFILAGADHGALGEATITVRTEAGTEKLLRVMIKRAANVVRAE